MVRYPMYNIGGDVGKGIPLWHERNETRNGSKLVAGLLVRTRISPCTGAHCVRCSSVSKP